MIVKDHSSIATSGENTGYLIGNTDPEFSKRISALRFVFVVLVVFIHSNMNMAIHLTDGDFVVAMPLWIQIINDTFSIYWGGIAVPTFFIISGYLFFAKPNPFVVTIRTKFKRLVIPYCLWIILTILIYYIGQSFEFSKPYFSVLPERIIRDWSISDFLSAFWNKSGGNPLVFQFWYLRNLMIMMLISPLIKCCAEKFPMAFFIFTTALYTAEMLHITAIPYGLTGALFYFSLGYYAVKNIGKIIEWLDAIRWRDFIAAYMISFVLMVYTNMNSLIDNDLINWFNLLFTICFAIKIAGVACKKEKLFEKLSYLSGFSFWIYAIHTPFILQPIRKISAQLIPMHDAWILVQFFGDVILCVGISLGLGIVLKKLFPKFYQLLNGGK